MIKELSTIETEVCLKNLYGKEESIIEYQKKRYDKLNKDFKKYFAQPPAKYFSSPGRTEISGNHTDHNHGKVIAASINLDSIAAASPTNDNKIILHSDGYNESFVINLDDLNPVEKEIASTSALLRGIAAGFVKHGFDIGGFNACISSDVLIGSGLSSSASIEVLIGTIFNYLYNDGKILPEEIAKIGQFAENEFFKKPCGLMDQVACAVGGIISIDFKDKENPKIDKINFDFSRYDYSLLFVHTGGSHINLTNDYAAIPDEMKQVANVFGKEVCREIEFDFFVNNINKIRNKVNDRAILRAYHFFKENERVKRQIDALNKNDFQTFLKFVNDSGDSSFKYLQNIYSNNDIGYQPVSLVLAMAENFIDKLGEGACRVHGGGFEGTIQVFLPSSSVNEFKKYIINAFDDFSILNLTIRHTGAVSVVDI